MVAKILDYIFTDYTSEKLKCKLLVKQIKTGFRTKRLNLCFKLLAAKIEQRVLSTKHMI